MVFVFVVIADLAFIFVSVTNRQIEIFGVQTFLFLSFFLFPFTASPRLASLRLPPTTPLGKAQAQISMTYPLFDILAVCQIALSA